MSKPQTISCREDFNRLHRKGKSFGSSLVVMVVVNNNLDYSRRAFLASKKVGNSVCRHRATRLMREAYRQIETQYSLPAGRDFLFIARNTIKDSKCADVKKSIEAAMKKAKVIS